MFFRSFCFMIATCRNSITEDYKGQFGVTVLIFDRLNTGAHKCVSHRLKILDEKCLLSSDVKARSDNELLSVVD